MVEPNGILNDGRRKSVAFVEVGWLIHPGIVTQTHLTCQYLAKGSVLGGCFFVRCRMTEPSFTIVGITTPKGNWCRAQR